MGEVAELIDYCVRRGGLNLSDISRWLDAHLPTVREWAYNGREPRLHKLPMVLARLKTLKELVDDAPVGALIPNNIRQPKRPEYITGLKDATFGILTEDTAR